MRKHAPNPNLQVTHMNEQAPQRVDPADEEGLVYWREKFGVTLSQLLDAVKAVGNDPDDIQEHFLTEGSSAGAG